MKQNLDNSDKAIRNAPIVFSVLMAINVACYALCNVMMVKIIEGKEASVLSMLLMTLCAVGGMSAGSKLAGRSKAAGILVGGLIAAIGVGFCIADATVWSVPGPQVMSTITGDSIFFTATYVLSDVFSEVFGYKASRISNITAAGFTLFANAAAKLMTLVPGPDYAQPNDDAFQFVYGGGFYVAIASVLIYMVGDFLNDKVFSLLKSKKSAKNTYGSYSKRSILSSLAGKSVDIGLFSLCVFIPFSNPTFCQAMGIESWGMTGPALLGNFFLGIAIQSTTEVALTPVSYLISRKLTKVNHNKISLNS